MSRLLLNKRDIDPIQIGRASSHRQSFLDPIKSPLSDRTDKENKITKENIPALRSVINQSLFQKAQVSQVPLMREQRRTQCQPVQ